MNACEIDWMSINFKKIAKASIAVVSHGGYLMSVSCNGLSHEPIFWNKITLYLKTRNVWLAKQKMLVFFKLMYGW